MIRGKLGKRLSEVVHCETGFNKIYFESALDILDEANKEFPTTEQAREFLLSMPKDIRQRTGFNLITAKLELIKRWRKEWFGETP